MSRQFNSVKHYLNVRDTLIYMSNSTNPVSAKDLENNVLTTKQHNIRLLLKQLAEAGLIEKVDTTGQTTFYRASELSLDIYKRESLFKWKPIKEALTKAPIVLNLGKQVKVEFDSINTILNMPDGSKRFIPSNTMCGVNGNEITVNTGFDCISLTTYKLQEFNP